MSTSNVDMVYVAGMGHSGSTVTGMLLGAKPGHFFIGEYKRITHLEPLKTCKCGASPTLCDFWGDVRTYDWHHMIERASEVTDGNKDTLVDSSKDFYELRKRHIDPNLKVRVVHLIRSPWRNTKKYGVSHLFSWVTAHTAITLYTWWHDIPTRRVGYQEVRSLKGSDLEERSLKEEYHFYTGNRAVKNNYKGIR